MREIRIGTWGEFEELVAGKIGGAAGSALFRGQGDSQWALRTTLQRATDKDEETMVNYHVQMQVVRDSLTSVLGQHWDTEKILYLPGFEVKGIEFMVYLRQHGFPSPLLDWTMSPYIAAYFAFRDVHRGPDRPEHVAIYIYEELADDDGEIQLRLQRMGGASVRAIGRFPATGKQPYLQQCQYTLCMRDEDGENCYAAYPDDFGMCDTRACRVEKYVIPLSEEETVFRRLQLMNVTVYSLFGMEAALLADLAVRDVFPGGR